VVGAGVHECELVASLQQIACGHAGAAVPGIDADDPIAEVNGRWKIHARNPNLGP
jgi:hypothetical protein